jgi:hypothetical protein
LKKLLDGNYVALTPLEVEKVLQEESALLPESVRMRRNNLLEESDVWALADRITPAWAAYRQALRDITAQEGFPYSVSWPTKP